MKKIETLLASELAANRTPSIQYYHFDSEKILHAFRAGWADIGEARKVDERTTFPFYSITKTITALAVVQLAEQGKLELDDPAVVFMPNFPYGGAVTIRHLLNHTAGIPNPIPLSWIHLAGEHDTFDRDAFFERVFAKHQKLKAPPGERFAYSNLGYVLLGKLIECVSGLSYEQYVMQHIVQPLELEPGALGYTIPDLDHHITGYHKQWSLSNLAFGFFIDKSKFMGRAQMGWKPFHPFYVNGSPYGGLLGLPLALVRYGQALLQDNYRLVSPPLKDWLFSEHRNRAGKGTGMCLSWFAGRFKEEPYVAHAGGGGGYYSEIRLYRQRKRGSAIFFNRSGLRDERYLDKVDGFAMGVDGG